MTAGRLLWRRADARNCSNGFVACWWWCGYKELDEYEVMAADLAGKDSWGKGKNCSFLNLTFKPSEPENCTLRFSKICIPTLNKSK